MQSQLNPTPVAVDHVKASTASSKRREATTIDISRQAGAVRDTIKVSTDEGIKAPVGASNHTVAVISEKGSLHKSGSTCAEGRRRELQVSTSDAMPSHKSQPSARRGANSDAMSSH